MKRIQMALSLVICGLSLTLPAPGGAMAGKAAAADKGAKSTPLLDKAKASPGESEKAKSSPGESEKVKSGKAAKPEKVPGDLALLKQLKKSWEGVSCTGQMNITVGGKSEPAISAPFAIANLNGALEWVAFITPPAPCAGTVVLGQVKIGPGNRPELYMGTPPGMVIGDKPALLTWKKLERSTDPSKPVNPGNLCGGQDQDGDSSMFSMFAGGMSHRPDKKDWDASNPDWLRLEGELKGTDKSTQGRYVAWLDKTRGYMPVKNMRIPAQGAVVQTVYEAKEVTPGHWLPVKWEVSGAGRPTMSGELKDLRCDRPLPKIWFEQASYPSSASENITIKGILGRP